MLMKAGIARMTNREAKKRIDELTEQINYHRKKYYLDDAPEITDDEFDALIPNIKARRRRR